jgi:hypothetical protein
MIQAIEESIGLLKQLGFSCFSKDIGADGAMVMFVSDEGYIYILNLDGHKTVFSSLSFETQMFQYESNESDIHKFIRWLKAQLMEIKLGRSR